MEGLLELAKTYSYMVDSILIITITIIHLHIILDRIVIIIILL